MKKLLVFVVCLVPLFFIALQVIGDKLGPDAGKELVLYCGQWSIRFLLITLCISPLRRLTGKSQLLRYRRMLGLFCWFYATLHLITVLTYLLGWSWVIFLEEFSERPYMALGITAWILLVPLGITSNKMMQRRMGQKWKSLHQVIYLIVVLACGHVIWMVRSDYGEALVYSLVALMLLGERFLSWRKRNIIRAQAASRLTKA